jgi:hypothetical protein
VAIKPHQLVHTIAASYVLANGNAPAVEPAVNPVAKSAAADPIAELPAQPAVDPIAGPAAEPTAAGPVADPSAELDQLLTEAYGADPFPNNVLRMVHDGVRNQKRITLAGCSEREGKLLYRGRIYVPDHGPLGLHLM